MTTKIPKISAKFYTTLAKKVNIADVTATLNSIADLDSDNLASGRYGFTIDEGNSSVEYFEADLVSTALSGIKVLHPTTLVETTGFLKEHRAGAEIKITDYTVLGRIRAVILGEDNLDNGAPIKYGTSPTLSDPLMLATVEYVLSVVNGGTVTFDAQVIAGVAGESISSGNWVYFKESDGRWYVTDANTSTTVKNVRLGMAKGAGTTGNAISGGVFVGGIEKTGTYSAGQAYYLSNTAGALSTSAGEYEAFVGVGDANGELLFLNVYDPEGTTPDEKDALAGSVGTPNTNNKYLTQNNASASATDQSQTTQNSTLEVGEADATTKKNKIAQSFKPTKEKIRAVSLYKIADTGTFTGTVKVALQADSSGSPDGSDLASRTLTNSEWSGFAVGDNEITFSSEYASMVCLPATTYWLVVTISTSDNSNHPNLGFNTAGGYANGTLKYNNTTDGWVEISGDDLYFKTHEGNNNQLITANASGKIESRFYSLSEMPMPAFIQDFALVSNETLTSPEFTAGSNKDGSVFYVIVEGGSACRRFERDATTGVYFQTHSVGLTTVPAGDKGGIVVVGDYIYLVNNDGTNIICSRYLASDLTGGTTMTVPTVACTSQVGAWTDGVNIYVCSGNSQTTSRKWSINGTTLTAVSTATVTTGKYAQGGSTMFDGTTAYVCEPSGNLSLIINKMGVIDGSTIESTTTKDMGLYSDTVVGGLIINIDEDRMYIGYLYSFYDETAQVSSRVKLVPITKP